MNINSLNIFHKWRLLLQFYKVLLITEDELIILLLLMHLLSEEYQFVTSEKLENFSNFDVNKIDKLLVRLLEKDYLWISNFNDKLTMSLTPLFNKIFHQLQDDNVIIEDKFVDINSVLITPLSFEQKLFIEQHLNDENLVNKVQSLKSNNKKTNFIKLQQLILNSDNKKSLSQFNWLITDMIDAIKKEE
ncbi:hypothetical protein [Spiroplasma endosymbiont of Agriotes lineatus]|uniref:hypothetical protein n=1 Tax=Spiroplasma endosymbiont of Agriotes lineatus TaxID=3077930 RepID=UPI0030CD18A9